MRGKASHASEPVRHSGIIPAGAGKRTSHESSGCSPRNHPRGCGEKFATVEGWHGVIGSSPRVRGKAELPKLNRDFIGIIPAGAGKRNGLATRSGAVGDHPRGCGEKGRPAQERCKRAGSSPRVRGKGGIIPRSNDHQRIIPAGAGKRERSVRETSYDWDHPRGCGEKPFRKKLRFRAWGSSPRVRGKVPITGRYSVPVGIIPAGAGKSQPPPALYQSRRDHPRGCGEKMVVRATIKLAVGSSPRVRGKAAASVFDLQGGGIIPAGAGKRCRRPGRSRSFGDHPRGCGEKSAVVPCA